MGDTLTCQIQDAIKTASAHVAIFSTRYAESNWCMDELHLMVKSGKPIIPVFYHVRPTELRWTRGKGVYAEALSNLKKKKTHDSQPRYGSATIEKWRNALSTVAEISGLDLEAFNGDEGELIDKVVESVSKKLKRTYFDVAEYPTGLDEKVQDFENKVLLVQQQQDKPQVIGIVGMGGMGKTTLVQELFNRKSSDYHRSCFLSDVRENAGKTSLHSLQNKLLNSLIQLDEKIESVSEGIELLKTHLSSCEALVILDDVDHVNQLNALLRPIRTVLHPHSLILITSRDKDVLTRSRVEESSIYKLTGLSTQQSQELFCRHAFTQGHPLPGFEDLVEKFLKACYGLPLSLKVFGALVYGNDKSFWEDQLDRLEQILPDEIQKRLQISYYALQMDEKQIFLDVACFFIGEKRDTAIRIWDGSGWKGSLGFQSLQNKSLVEVDTENEIRMHHHLRDMGRDLANDPGLPRRFWRWNQIDDLFQQSSVVAEVRGISIRLGKYQDKDVDNLYKDVDNLYVTISRDKLDKPRKMRKLQLLDMDMDHFYLDNAEDVLESILSVVHSPNLLWLRCDNCLYHSLPSWIPVMNLRVLKVGGQKLETLWQEASQVPLQLRELEIEAPLSDIPKSIGLLKHLERIVVKGSAFENLPEEFSHLLSLKYLKIVRSGIRSLPESFGNLTNLKHIDLSHSWELEGLPNSFGNLTNLKHINLSSSMELEGLPNSFGNLTGLKHLDLSHCISLNLSRETLGNICTLEYIDLTGCDRIEVLPSQLSHQQSLEILDLELENLIELPSDLGELRSLKSLNLRNCYRLKFLPDSLGRLNQLTKITIDNCSLCQLSFKLIEAEGEGESICPSLQSLHITGCKELLEVGILPDALIELQLTECPQLRKIGLCNLAKLETLCISYCIRLEEVPNIETLVSLKELDASGCAKLRSIRGLAQLTKLRRLDVCDCSELEELVGVEQLRSLKWLNAFACSKLQGILPRGGFCIVFNETE